VWVADGLGLGVAVRLLVGVGVAVAELLGEGVGLDVAWLVGVDDGWAGVGEGVAIEGVGVGEGVALGAAVGLCVATAPAVGSADEDAAAITNPATTATRPPTMPTPSNRRNQGKPWSAPGTGPSPANGCLSTGLDSPGRHPFRPPVLAAARQQG
jgi:hypothetical protein